MPLFQLWCFLLAPSDSLGWDAKNHSLCNCNCHSFSLPIKRFSSPTGLVLQDSGCLHFKNSPLFIFKRRKGKKETKVLFAFQASRTVVRSKSRAIQNFDSPRSCMENAVGGSNTRTWKNGKEDQSCWLALTRKPIPCWFQRSSKDARFSLSIVISSHFVMTNKTIPQSNKSCVLQIQNSWSERENRKRTTSRGRQVVHSQANSSLASTDHCPPAILKQMPSESPWLSESSGALI